MQTLSSQGSTALTIDDPIVVDARTADITGVWLATAAALFTVMGPITLYMAFLPAAICGLASVVWSIRQLISNRTTSAAFPVSTLVLGAFTGGISTLFLLLIACLILFYVGIFVLMFVAVGAGAASH